MKRPSFQFYPGDWLNDAKLKMADWELKGLWMDLMCHMHNSYDYGYLVVEDQYLDQNGIQRLLNANPKRFHRVFNSLKTAKIIGIDSKGFYSKRMVEDERIRRIRAEAGEKGGNPLLLKQTVNQTVKQNPTPSSSSSTSSSKTPPTPKGEWKEAFNKFWGLYPKKTTKQETEDFFKANSLHLELDQILNGLNAWKMTDQWTKDGGKFIPDPIRFLRKKRWKDDLGTVLVVPPPKKTRREKLLEATFIRDRYSGELIPVSELEINKDASIVTHKGAWINLPDYVLVNEGE